MPRIAASARQHPVRDDRVALENGDVAPPELLDRFAQAPRDIGDVEEGRHEGRAAGKLGIGGGEDRLGAGHMRHDRVDMPGDLVKHGHAAMLVFEEPRAGAFDPLFQQGERTVLRCYIMTIADRLSEADLNRPGDRRHNDDLSNEDHPENQKL